MLVIPIGLYLAACALCGLMGRNTAFGFFGHFVLAIIISPVGDFLLQLAGRPCRRLREKLNRLP